MMLFTLPDDLLAVLFSKLQTMDILEMAILCKYFYNLIKHDAFWRNLEGINIYDRILTNFTFMKNLQNIKLTSQKLINNENLEAATFHITDDNHVIAKLERFPNGYIVAIYDESLTITDIFGLQGGFYGNKVFFCNNVGNAFSIQVKNIINRDILNTFIVDFKFIHQAFNDNYLVLCDENSFVVLNIANGTISKHFVNKISINVSLHNDTLLVINYEHDNHYLLKYNLIENKLESEIDLSLIFGIEKFEILRVQNFGRFAILSIRCDFHCFACVDTIKKCIQCISYSSFTILNGKFMIDENFNVRDIEMQNGWYLVNNQSIGNIRNCEFINNKLRTFVNNKSTENIELNEYTF